MTTSPHEQESLRDPLIDEVREIRREISERFDNDVDRLCDYLRELGAQYPDRILSPSAAAKAHVSSAGGHHRT